MGRAAQIVGLCPSAPGTPSPQGLTQYRSSKEKKTAFAATLGEIANPGIQTGQLFTSPIPSTNGIAPKPLVSSVYVHILEAPSPLRRSISVMSPSLPQPAHRGRLEAAQSAGYDPPGL